MSVERLLGRLNARVRASIGRAIVGLVNDSTKLQAVQVTLRADETRDDAEHFQHYGFTSHPLPGAEGVGLAVGGSSDHVVVVCIDDRRFRLKGLQEGEVALYTDQGDKMIFKRNGVIEITGSTKLVLATPLVEIAGNVTVGGNVTVAGTVVATGNVSGAGKSLAGHVHGGVTAGGANTGVPV